MEWDELMDAGLAQSGVLYGVLNVEPFGSFPILPRRCDYNGLISIGDDEAAQSQSLRGLRIWRV